MGIGKIPPQCVAALDRFSTVVRGCQRMIELESRQSVGSERTQQQPVRFWQAAFFSLCLIG